MRGTPQFFSESFDILVLMVQLDGIVNRADFSANVLPEKEQLMAVPPCGIQQIQDLVNKITQYLHINGWFVSYEKAQLILANQQRLPKHEIYQVLIEEALFVKKQSELATPLFQRFIETMKNQGAIIKEEVDGLPNIIQYSLLFNGLKFSASISQEEQVIIVSPIPNRWGSAPAQDITTVHRLFCDFAAQQGISLMDLYAESNSPHIDSAFQTCGRFLR